MPFFKFLRQFTLGCLYSFFSSSVYNFDSSQNMLNFGFGAVSPLPKPPRAKIKRGLQHATLP